MLGLVREPMPAPKRGEVRIRVGAGGVSFGDEVQRPGCSSHREDALYSGYDSAWQMLRRFALVRGGDAILVYGGSGGVGAALLELAKHLRLVVAAAVSRRWRDSLAGQAALLFDERELSPGEVRLSGFDASFDAIGGSHIWRTRMLVASHGVLVAFGVANAVKAGGGRNLADVVRLSLLRGFAKLWHRPRVELYARDQPVKRLRHEINEDLRGLIALLYSGTVDLCIGAAVALHGAQRAYELLESRNNIGKIVLVP